MVYAELVAFIQSHFRDGLVLVVGSGLSAAEGIPGMDALAKHLKAASVGLKGEDAIRWQDIATDLGSGLEAALLKHPPTETLEGWIVEETIALLLPKEREILAQVVQGSRVLRITTFLDQVLKPPSGIPILTPNYDRLVEAGCEMAGLHVDTTAIGQFAGKFDHERSCMASCRGVRRLGKQNVLDHFPRAIVLKPHGSFDWYRGQEGPLRSVIDLNLNRLIITPGLNKYRAGYDPPFDKHRELANEHIKRAGRLLIIGYGFNDDHLQPHLVKRIRDGTPTLILTRSASEKVIQLAIESPNCICISKPESESGIVVQGSDTNFTRAGSDLWDLGQLTQELLK